MSSVVMKKPQFLIVFCLPILQFLNWLGEGKALMVPSFICSLQELVPVSQLCRISKRPTCLPVRELGTRLY